ncbi:MAG: ABC transporter permease subunit [Gemmatimonadota bacterium]|nr:ABC transporter permease subunit [Gemmatimonadota bacterium]
MIDRPLVRRELRDAVRRYWFLVNAGAFALAGLLLMVFGQSESVLVGSRGFARALAGLMQLALVFVPLMALVPAVVAIAGEREAGTLDYLLAQPVTRGRVFVDKWIGVSTAVVLSVVVGLALTAMAAAAKGVPPGPIAALLGCTVLLAAAFVSIGLWISAVTASRTKATSLGLTVWLGLVGLGSLGVMSAFVKWGLPPVVLESWALVNPVEAYRLAAVVALDPETGVLGPVGQALLDRLGSGGVIAAAVASLAGWSALGFGAGYRAFGRLDRGSGGGRERVPARA